MSEVKYEMVPETVVENGVRRMTGKTLYFDQSGNAVDPYTATGVIRPEQAEFAPTAQVKVIDREDSILDAMDDVLAHHRGERELQTTDIAVPTEAASVEAVPSPEV